MPRHVRRSTTFGTSRQHGSRAIDDRPSRKQGGRAGSTKSRVLPSNPAGRMRGRAGPFPGSQVDKRQGRRISRDNLLDWDYPRPRVNLRGNHALSVANSASGNEGQCFASGRPDQWAGRWDQRDDLQACRSLFLETRPNLGPRCFKKSLGPALRARLIQVRSVIRPQSFRNFRRHKIHTKSRRDGLCISDFRFGFRNHR